jgi:hypothetical protein
MAIAALVPFCRFCRDVLSTEYGRQLLIEPFQERILADSSPGAPAQHPPPEGRVPAQNCPLRRPPGKRLGEKLI